jgi:diacylglycerol kinase (ATP)
VKALFVVNERSGRRRDFDVSDLIRTTAAFEHEVLSCGNKEDLDAIVDRAEADAVDVVFAVGGDGTVHETAKRLIGRRPALGILPIGSGNGFARHIGLPMDPAQSITASGAGHIVEVDTARVNDMPFLGVMGVGFDAAVADRFAASTTRGLESYVREGFRAFTAFHPEEYELVVDGVEIRTKALVVAIANSGQYGNNARIAPLASLQDGLLDVVVIHDATLVEAPILLARLFTGTIHEARGVTTMQAKEIVVRRPAAGPAHLDGEPLVLPEELRIQVVPSSMRLLVPESSVKL